NRSSPSEKPQLCSVTIRLKMICLSSSRNETKQSRRSPTSRECQLIHNPKFLLFAQGTPVSPPKSPCASPAGEFQHLTEV
ncbi:hypothetical protein XENOCAPTIV_001856, partial [Xenoophorus captivus]